MSGRDYRSFVSGHRSEIVTDKKSKEESVDRLNGTFRKKCKPVDYDKLKALTAERKFAANESSLKVKKISQVSRQSKHQSLIKQHRLVWHKELLKLNSSFQHLQTDLDRYLMSTENLDLDELQNYESMIESNFVDFKTASVKPVLNLKENLDYLLLHKEKPNTDMDSQKDIKDTIETLSKQQYEQGKKLATEQQNLEEEIKNSWVWNSIQLSHDNKRIVTGIPFEAYDLECPDEDLKVSVLEEFINLDERYLNRLANLDESHSVVLDSPLGLWNEDDHFKFQSIVDQYPRDMSHRQKLYIDRLMREFDNRFTKTELINHDTWCVLKSYYKERRKAVISDWTRDRTELLNKTKNMFVDLCQIHEKEQVFESDKRKQKQLCAALYEKVRIWREQKHELMKLEEEIQRKYEEKERENIRQESEREEKRRELERDRIKGYRLEKEQKQLQFEEESLRRLEELKQVLEEQANYDQKRIAYREEQTELKRQLQLEREERRKQDDFDKECRLEALRELVRVKADSDPGRLISDTEVWKAHKLKNEDEVDEMKPYQLNTFTAQQITSDPRIKLEERLRGAGVHNTDYARKTLSMMAPPTQPRRDMESTLFNRDNSLKRS